jgi:hypothetical protein
MNRSIDIIFVFYNYLTSINVKGSENMLHRQAPASVRPKCFETEPLVARPIGQGGREKGIVVICFPGRLDFHIFVRKPYKLSQFSVSIPNEAG